MATIPFANRLFPTADSRDGVPVASDFTPASEIAGPGGSLTALPRVGNTLVPNVWYKAGWWGITLAQALAVNVLRAVPFLTGRPFTIDRLAFNITSVGGAGSRTRIGIYRAAQGVGLPTDLLVNPAEHVTDGGAADTRISVFNAITLTDPLYWFVYFTGAAGVGPTIRTIAATDGIPIFGHPQADLTTTQTHVTAALAYGALPSVFPAPTFASANYPVVACRGV